MIFLDTTFVVGTFSIIQEDAVPGLGIKYLHSDSVLMELC